MRLVFSTPLQAGLLLAISALCALVSNALAEPSRHLGWGDQVSAAVSSPPAAGMPVSAPSRATIQPADRFAADPAQPIREISSEEAWVLYQAQTLFLDARRSLEYTEGHIAGAWNVSVWEATAATRITEFEAAGKPGSTTPLVLYCSGGSCEDSHLLANRLTPLGYRNLFIYRAGYPDWVEQRRPIGQGVRP
jgi:rhodanese-related sulfurtransferase